MVPTEEMLEQSKDAPLIITEDSEATIGTETLHAAFQHVHRVEELESDEKCELQIRPGISANRSPPADSAPCLSQSKHVDQQACWTRRPYSRERPSRLLRSGLPIPRNLVRLDPPNIRHIPRHALIDTVREVLKPIMPYPRGRVHSRIASGSRGTPRSDSISNRAPTWGFEGYR